MKLSVKEQLFCYYYYKHQSVKQAAILAGYSDSSAETTGAKLIQNPKITDYINHLSKQIPCTAMVKSGLEKLAAGSNNDAISLILHDGEINPDTLQALDLMGVSEIKRLKDGAFEIKFFDRIKAFAQLAELCGNEENDSNTHDFLAALQNSVNDCKQSE